jgi:hypothetical protein
MESRRIERLRRGDWQFGHQGRHNGVGTEECPRELHHHHDEMVPLNPNMLRVGGVHGNKACLDHAMPQVDPLYWR